MSERVTPLRAIRKKCLECSCGSKSEVKQCPILACPLYPYRDGHSPARQGIGGKRDYSPKNPNSRRVFLEDGVSEGKYTIVNKPRKNSCLDGEIERRESLRECMQDRS